MLDPTPLLYLYMLDFIPMIDVRPAMDSSAILIRFTSNFQH